MAKKGTYLNTLSNESAKAISWKIASFFLAGLVIYLGYLLKVVIEDMPVKLIPYGFETNKGVLEVSANGEKNQEYIKLIASGDAALFVEYKPDDAIIKTKRLLNRFTPGLYATTQSGLLNQAEQNRDERITQTYVIERIKSRDGLEVLIYGQLKRWEGNKLVSEGPIHFAISYRYLDGIPYIQDFTPFKDESEVVDELNTKNEN